MPHWKSMMDREWLFAFDLQGREVVVTIGEVKAGTLIGEGGRKSKKPVVRFTGKDKPLALNSTNAKTIAAMYGNDTDAWIGKRITIYPTTTEMGGQTVECIRVRPQVPSDRQAANGRRAQAPAPRDEEIDPVTGEVVPPPREPGAEG